MSTTARGLHHYTYAQYVDLEDQSSIRHEYLDGEIYAMAGGTPDHAALAATVIHLLRARMVRECRAFTSDLRVRIPSTGLSTYPNATVVCGRTTRAADDPIAVVNPVLLVEVTSDSTEDYDRDEKLSHYRQLPSLREVLIVSHREPRLTLHRREDADWITLDRRSGEDVKLESVAVRLEVGEVYRDELEDVSPVSR